MAKKKRFKIDREKPSQNDDDKVGPGKPPRRTQFKKGQSGNPSGRPKGSRNLDKLIIEAAERRIPVNIDGKSRRISMLQSSVWNLAIQAARGDQKATAAFLDRIEENQARVEVARPTEYPLSDADLEVIRTVYDRLKKPAKDQDS
jgi:hypothetical protein